MRFDINPETENIVSAVYNTLMRTIVPALRVCSGWGDVNPPNPKSADIINYYISKVMLFMDYLASEFFNLYYLSVYNLRVVKGTF